MVGINIKRTFKLSEVYTSMLISQAWLLNNQPPPVQIQ